MRECMHNSGALRQQRTMSFSYWAASSDRSRRADLCQLKVSEWHICISKPITKTLWINLGIHEFTRENGSLPFVLRHSKTPFLKHPNNTRIPPPPTPKMTQVVTFPPQSSLHYCTWLSVFLPQKTWSALLTCLYECLFRDGASALPIKTEGTISWTSRPSVGSAQSVACKSGVFCSLKDDTIKNVLPPSWTLKLTESWGESKNDSKGEVDKLK